MVRYRRYRDRYLNSMVAHIVIEDYQQPDVKLDYFDGRKTHIAENYVDFVTTSETATAGGGAVEERFHITNQRNGGRDLDSTAASGD